MYGPTVLITTLVASAISRSESGSVTSARSRGTSAPPAPRRRRPSSSLLSFLPASAHRVSAGAWRARYSAVSAPVKPVAPNTTMSYERSATGVVELAGDPQRLVQLDAGAGGDPARGRRRDPVGGVGRLGREVEDRLELLRRERPRPELLGVGRQPVSRVHAPGL